MINRQHNIPDFLSELGITKKKKNIVSFCNLCFYSYLCKQNNN